MLLQAFHNLFEHNLNAGAENVESTLEDAYLYHTQITGGEKNATL